MLRSSGLFLSVQIATRRVTTERLLSRGRGTAIKTFGLSCLLCPVHGRFFCLVLMRKKRACPPPSLPLPAITRQRVFLHRTFSRHFPVDIESKQVEELNGGGNHDEKDMDRYLKAHDDLQTVLRVYDGVLDGNEPLPLSRGSGGGRSLGEATASAEAAFAAAAANGKNGTYSSDDSAEGGGGGDAGGGKGGGAAAAGTGTNSPAKGNLLDLEENAPLETGMTGEGAGGMLVAYTDGQFMASNTHGGVGFGGVSGVGGAGFGSSSSNQPGSSATASNFASASDTGAVYGSNQFGSNNQSTGNQFGSSNFGSVGGGGEGPSGFGEQCGGRFGCFSSACPVRAGAGVVERISN